MPKERQHNNTFDNILIVFSGFPFVPIWQFWIFYYLISHCHLPQEKREGNEHQNSDKISRHLYLSFFTFFFFFTFSLILSCLFLSIHCFIFYCSNLANNPPTLLASIWMLLPSYCYEFHQFSFLLSMRLTHYFHCFIFTVSS